MKKIFLHIFLFLALIELLVCCSTTRAIPEGEQLYTGIKEITYNEKQTIIKKKKGNDSTGVITAVADAAQAVNDVLTGKATINPNNPLIKKEELTKEERKEQKAEQAQEEADFATAKEEVEAVLAYPPNNSIFGSSSMSWPWKIGLWIHNGLYDSKGKFGKWIFRTLGTEPVLISNVSPDLRIKVATNTLHNYGYFRGKISYDILTQDDTKKAKLAYHVQAGKLFRLDSIVYQHFPASMDSVLRLHQNERLLKSGDAFSVVNLSAEQSRIETLLRNNGYYYFNSSYTTFRADTIMRPEKVQLQVVPVSNRPAKADHPWYMGHVIINVRQKEMQPLEKTLTRRNYTYNFSGEKIPLRPNLWHHAITHRTGHLYKQTDEEMTLQKLGELGVFSSIDVGYMPRDTSVNCDTLDLIVSAVMDKMYDSTFEMNATFKSNQQVGPGISYELAKRNAFRGAEKVSFKIFGSYEWQTGKSTQGRNSLLNSYELGTELAFTLPRFVFPVISRKRLRFPATTQLSLNADWRNRSKFFNMFTMGLDMKYHWYRRETAQNDLTIFSLQFNKLNHTTFAFDSVMTANPALYVSMRDQFVPSMSYTFTYQSRSWRKNPWYVQLHIKEAGNITSAIFAACGKSFNEKDKKLVGNPFAQYVKVTAELHKKFTFTDNVNLATRLFGGVIYSYGNSNSAPYTDQFYVGGANSIRGFTVRSIGPGSYKPTDSKYSYMDQIGDVKLEANAELRARLFGDLHGAIFLDAGNVWLLREDTLRPGAKITAKTLKNIALGTGFGLRYDMDFLVLRFDVGVALHAPYKTTKSGFYNIEKIKDGLGLHFAIGYPF